MLEISSKVGFCGAHLECEVLLEMNPENFKLSNYVFH